VALGGVLSEADPISRGFAWIVARRAWILAFYALLLPPAAWFAAQVEQDNSTDRLILPTDPDYEALQAFGATFGSGEYALLIAEAEDPLDPAVIERIDRIERALRDVPNVDPNSIVSVFRRARAGFEPTPEQCAELRRFATGTDLLRKQGLIGDHHLAIALTLTVKDPAQRNAALDGLERAVAPVRADPGPIRDLAGIGQPFVNSWLDRTLSRDMRYFAVFAAFLIALVLGLYRSARTLLAFLITLGTCVAVCVAYIVLTGGSLTIVSPMVPMSILVTATSSLVYLQSRFVERPPDRPVDEHQIFALRNKFVAVTASIFATAVGFGALVVSDIRPIREMGIWVAIGLAFTWAIVFTLFPALQKALRTPTGAERRSAGAAFERLAEVLPGATYRMRWPLVVGAVVLSVLGAVALFGFPGIAKPMPIHTDPVEYLNPKSTLYQDIRRLAPKTPGLGVTHLWIRGPVGSVAEPEVLTALHHLQEAIEADPAVGAAVGPTSILRLVRYLGGGGDQWPADSEGQEEMSATLEAILPREPMIGRFVQRHGLGETQITVISRAAEHEAFVALEASLRKHWDAAVAAEPALAQFTIRPVGLAPLQARVAQALVPTLVESFALTVAIIFGAFLLVFRSGSARLLALIPSIFAILVMFLVMRLFGMKLNVATILIASTVLGTSENDQIHFFYHFLERRKDGNVEAALRHALQVAGRAIFFATLINAGGFLGFVAGQTPAMREFGLLAALAFTLSMVADFTALLAALWLISREKPAVA
jgi:predicted RND superfamily exporter protein